MLRSSRGIILVWDPGSGNSKLEHVKDHSNLGPSERLMQIWDPREGEFQFGIFWRDPFSLRSSGGKIHIPHPVKGSFMSGII
jgi:hypothetical protein